VSEVIYHYTNSSRSIIDSGTLRLYRYAHCQRDDEMHEGLEHIREILICGRENYLLKHFEELVSEHVYYLACFTDNPNSSYHQKYGTSILCFDKEKLDIVIWDTLGAMTIAGSDSCFIKCVYDKKENSKTIRAAIEKIKNESHSLLYTCKNTAIVR